MPRIKLGTVMFRRLHLSSTKSEADMHWVIPLLVTPWEEASVFINLHPVCHRELAWCFAKIPRQQTLLLIFINRWLDMLHHLIVHVDWCCSHWRSLGRKKCLGGCQISCMYSTWYIIEIIHYMGLDSMLLDNRYSNMSSDKLTYDLCKDAPVTRCEMFFFFTL